MKNWFNVFLHSFPLFPATLGSFTIIRHSTSPPTLSTGKLRNFMKIVSFAECHTNGSTKLVDDRPTGFLTPKGFANRNCHFKRIFGGVGTGLALV
jgi:hypothetical protein